jgi:benzoate/toluate 1,2-dioxygenase reductase subunit
MTYRIALNFEDGVTRFIDCKADETVADAAYRQGVNVPIDCRDGACGACKSSCESGSFALRDYIEDALSAEEAAQRMVLTCQMVPQSDCVVAVPTSSASCKIKPAQFDAVIDSLQQLSPSTIALTLSGAALARLAFLPGQYANLQIPGSQAHRAYSFSSMPREGRVSFLLRNVPGGSMSRYLSEQARVGDAIRFSAPLGAFYLRPIRRPLLLLAGGTGLAPFLAMLEKIAADGGSPQPVHLIYGVNTDADLVEVEALREHARRLGNFSYDLVVVDPGSAQPKRGYVTAWITPELLHAGDVDVYLCGPPPMVEAVAHDLRARGVEPAAFHYEKFAPSQP